MAIAFVSPTTSRRSAQFPTPSSTSQTDLKVVSNRGAAKSVDRRTYATFLISVAVLGLLALLGINTALSQGAFELTRLKTQATTLNDQREAVMKKIAKESSPQVLAYRAKVAGMVPSISPRFLAVGPTAEATPTKPNTRVVR